MPSVISIKLLCKKISTAPSDGVAKSFKLLDKCISNVFFQILLYLALKFQDLVYTSPVLEFL